MIMATQLGSMEIFNVKIIEYANGQVEVRKYSEPIGADKLGSINMTQEQAVRRIELGKKFSAIRREGEIEFNPFTETEERIQTFEQLDMEKERAEKNLRDSLNRSKNAVYQYARQSRWKYFITLTFDPQKVDRSDYSACMKIANEWFHNQRKRYAPDLKYLYLGELHSDKVNWHIHGLIDNVGDIKFTDSGKLDRNGHKIYNLGSWTSGWTTAVAIEQTDESIFKMSNYVTKYITKDLCMRTKGKRRYYRSNNIDEPKIHVAWLKPSEIDNYINEVIDSIGATLEYEKSCRGFVDVNYRYYKKKERKKKNG